MRRIYFSVIQKHFEENDQMLFLVGPRQVGKTTIAQEARTLFKESSYFTWDSVKDRTMILEGQNFIESLYPINKLRSAKPLLIFDEIHKYKDWKNWLKGFFDLYKAHFHILVTGSARLDIYKAGSDSLMGRYFLSRVHPLTVGEILHTDISAKAIREPHAIDLENMKKLYKFGGFPQLYLRADEAFAKKWHSLREKQLFYEDIQSLASIQEVGQIEALAALLKHQVGQLLNRTSLSKKIQVTVPTVSRWLETLERFFYCFHIKPWHTNISRSIIKEPKVYLWDWSSIENPGMRFENFIACHLLKAVQMWNDLGLGDYGLYFMRNKDKMEVDFVLTKDNQVWVLIEAKSSANNSISKNLYFFHNQTKAPFAFQVVNTEEYENVSCFQKEGIWIVPAKTLLSQLV